MVNCMFLYNFASLMLEILCLKYVLDDILDCRNLRNALEWQNHAQNREEGASTKRRVYMGIGLRMQG